MQKLKGFPAFGSHTVGLKIDLEDGEGEVTQWPVTHVFREPNAEDKKLYFSEMAKRQVKEKRSGVMVLTVADMTVVAGILYDQIITSVTGYDFGGKQPKNWRDNIACEHKQWSIDRLLKNTGTISPVIEKN